MLVAPASNTNALPTAGAPFSKDELATARGIGILLVVVGHIPHAYLGSSQVYHFHMPAFFALAGMGLRPDRGVVETIVFHAKSFLLYAAAMCFVYTIVGRGIDKVTGLTFVQFAGWDVRHFTTEMWTFSCHHVRLFSVGWFLLALGVARPLATFAVKAAEILPRVARKPALLAIALGAGYFGMVHTARWTAVTGNPYYNCLTQVIVAMAFVIHGYLVATTPWVRSSVRSPIAAGTAVCVLLLFLGNDSVQVPSLAWSQYPSGFVSHTFLAAAGTLVLLHVSSVLTRVSRNRVFPFLGKHSKSIMAHHLFVFVLLNLAFAAAGKLALANVDVFASYACQWTWPLYLAGGVAVPSLAAAAWQRFATRRRPPNAERLDGRDGAA